MLISNQVSMVVVMKHVKISKLCNELSDLACLFMDSTDVMHKEAGYIEIWAPRTQWNLSYAGSIEGQLKR